jgi:hypothetical protein
MINLMIFSDRPIEISPASGSSRSSGKGLCLGARICDTGVGAMKPLENGRLVRKHKRILVPYLRFSWAQKDKLASLLCSGKLFNQSLPESASWWLGIKLNEH